MGSYRRTLAAAVATILASVSLYPIFIGTSWFWAGVGAVLTVAVAGSLTRLRRLPVIVCMVAVLAGLLLYLNVAFESARSRFLVVPTPTSLHALWNLAGLGFSQSAKYAPPVPGLSGMVLLTAGGIGLAALLTDLIAVRLESAALAGLPLLLLFTEPFTLSVSRSGVETTVAFCCGTAGYLALLSSEGKDRIREWERPDPDPDQMPNTRALTAAGRRVGVASVVIALCLPVFVPGLHTTRLFGGQPGIGGNAGGGSGAGVGFPDPNTELSSELHETQATTVFTYSTSDSTAPYFQLFVLDNLTSSGWQLFAQPESLAPASPRMPSPPGVTDITGWATPETTNVSISPDVSQDALVALPVPYPATSITAPGDVRAETNTLMVFDNGQRLAGLTYTVNSLDESPTAQQIDQAPAPAAAIIKYYLQTPGSYDSLHALAESVVDAAHAKTPFEKALALQEWLSGNTFTYTLDAPSVTNAKQLTAFLETTKKGYCEQFSFAMAVLARLLGIPSRVAYGFTGGTLTSSGTYVVTTHDAHAWPELYFQGFGWLRFEPTPTGAGGQGTASAPSYTLEPVNALTQSPTSASPTPSPTSSAGAGGSAAALRQRLNLPLGDVSGGVTYPVLPSTLSAWDIAGIVVLCLLGLLLLAAATPSLARLAIRRRRWRSGARGGDAGLAHAAWRELRDDLVDYRAGYLPSESPRALAARVGESLELTGPATAALRRITMAEERARYAARPDSGTGLHEDSTTVRRAIAAAVPRRRRWLARLLPSSVLTPTMIRVTQAADAVGSLNPELPGSARLRRFGRGRGRAVPPAPRSAGAKAPSGSEPPVGAGTRR